MRRVVTRRLTHTGKREDLDNRYFRSMWEANFARYLNFHLSKGIVNRWEYESETYAFPVKRGNRFYTVDFVVHWASGAVERYEIKGYWDNDSKVKMRRLAKHYPDIYKTMHFIGPKEYRQLADFYGRMLPGWERERKTNTRRI